MIRTNRCIECGVNTLSKGFVNRYPVFTTCSEQDLESWMCGNCAVLHESAPDDDAKHEFRDYWYYQLDKWISEVDDFDPLAERFRDLLDIGNRITWTSEQEKEFLKLR